MEKRWVYKENPDLTLIDELGKSININPYLSKILIQRGFKTFDEAKDFFRPSLDRLYDPFAMKDMDRAVNRLTEAVFANEKILLYGDYDVDGTTSVSLLYLFLKDFSPHIEYYIPDRYSEGYGISEKGINHAIANDFSLIIALDCGIRAVERAEQAQNADIDLIICDHHLPGEQLPAAFAILDPKREDCKYPFSELSGCGVGFKLLEGFCQQNTIHKNQLFNLLDLVAVSIASDIVPIIDENRILAYYGLKKLNTDPSAGLQSLIALTGKKHELSISDVVFYLGPRINAAGRLSHARESVRLLIGGKENASTHADVLNHRNRERRAFDEAVTTEALEMIAATPKKKSTVLFKPDWHKGVVGIVASRCIEHYYRPTIILTESNGKATGSARSVRGFDIYQAISACADLLEQYGGHRYAAGLTLPLDLVPNFIERFESVVNKTIAPDMLIPKIEIDTDLPLSAINFKMYSILSQMAPFGPENMAPVFGTHHVTVGMTPKLIKDKHLKGTIRDEKSTQQIDFIGFNMADKLAQMVLGKPFHILYHIEENNYLGNRTLSLNLIDVKFDA